MRALRLGGNPRQSANVVRPTPGADGVFQAHRPCRPSPARSLCALCISAFSTRSAKAFFSSPSNPSEETSSSDLYPLATHPKSLSWCVTNTETSPWCCAEDGSRSPGVGLRGLASNHRVLLRSKGVVVSNAAKGDRQGRQVGIEKVSASEPLITHRKDLDAVETGGARNSRDKSESDVLTAQTAAGV